MERSELVLVAGVVVVDYLATVVYLAAAFRDPLRRCRWRRLREKRCRFGQEPCDPRVQFEVPCWWSSSCVRTKLLS